MWSSFFLDVKASAQNAEFNLYLTKCVHFTPWQ